MRRATHADIVFVALFTNVALGIFQTFAVVIFQTIFTGIVTIIGPKFQPMTFIALELWLVRL